MSGGKPIAELLGRLPTDELDPGAPPPSWLGWTRWCFDPGDNKLQPPKIPALAAWRPAAPPSHRAAPARGWIILDLIRTCQPGSLRPVAIRRAEHFGIGGVFSH
jgi:hypothetical protein